MTFEVWTASAESQQYFDLWSFHLKMTRSYKAMPPPNWIWNFSIWKVSNSIGWMHPLVRPCIILKWKGDQRSKYRWLLYMPTFRSEKSERTYATCCGRERRGLPRYGSHPSPALNQPSSYCVRPARNGAACSPTPYCSTLGSWRCTVHRMKRFCRRFAGPVHLSEHRVPGSHRASSRWRCWNCEDRRSTRKPTGGLSELCP